MCQHIFDPGLVMIHGYPLFFVGSLRPILLNLVHYLAKGTWSRSNYYRCQLSPCPFHSHVVAAALCKFVNTCCPSWIWNVTAPLPHYLFWSKNCGMDLPLTYFFFWQVQWFVPFILAHYKITDHHQHCLKLMLLTDVSVGQFSNS